MSSLPDSLLRRFTRHLAAHTGLHFDARRRRELERGLIAAGAEERCGAESFVQRLLSRPLTRATVEKLARHLTVGETYFFRDPAIFAALRQNVLPELIARRAGEMRSLRLWSAGCSSGEEAYSLAICLAEMIPSIEDWNISILATDIDPAALARVRQATYRTWSFRGDAVHIRDRHFRESESGWTIAPRIRRLVTCEYLNLAEDAYPSLTTNTNAMDVIFCRNVLMYFTPRRARAVIERLRQSLVDGGWLVVGGAEHSQEWFHQFETVQCPGAILYRKSSAGVAGAFDVNIEIPETVSDGSLVEQTESAVAGPAGEETRSVALEPAAPLSLAEQARDAANRGELQRALEFTTQALCQDRANAALYYLRATVLQEMNKLTEAQSDLRRALYLDPDFAVAHFALGNVARRSGKEKDAERAFRNCLALLGRCSPEDVVAGAEGMSAGRLREIVSATLASEEAA